VRVPTATLNLSPDLGQLVSLTGTKTGTYKTDSYDWKSLNGSHDSNINVKVIPASDAAVTAYGQQMNKFLGTPDKPGSIKYDAFGGDTSTKANSNGAASSVANGAVQSEHPGAPVVTPPTGGMPPGWARKIDVPNQCVRSQMNNLPC
jgi:hypothetical protein